MRYFKREGLLTLLALFLCACAQPSATPTPHPTPSPTRAQPAPTPPADAEGPPPCTQIGQTWRSLVDGGDAGVCAGGGVFDGGCTSLNRDLRVTARASGQARHYFDGQMGFRCALDGRAP